MLFLCKLRLILHFNCRSTVPANELGSRTEYGEVHSLRSPAQPYLGNGQTSIATLELWEQEHIQLEINGDLS
jgi:hypothetical protein